MKHFTLAACRRLIVATFLLLAALIGEVQAQNVLRVKYYLPAGQQVPYYTKEDRQAGPKVEKSRIVTSKTGTATILEDVTKVATTEPTEPMTKVRKYGSLDPAGTGFSVEQKKDTIFLTPIPWYPKTGQSLTSQQTAMNSSRVTHTYFLAIPKTTGYSVLYSKFNEFGVLAIPARLYLTYNSGLKAQPVLGAGVAAYYGWSRGTDYFYDGGTTLRTTVTRGMYLGFSQIAVKAGNTDNKVTADSDEPAVTLGYAQLYGRGDFKIGFIAGTDLPLTGKGWKWDFAPSVYLGTAVSLAISPLTLK